jgi:hypothetical protein
MPQRSEAGKTYTQKLRDYMRGREGVSFEVAYELQKLALAKDGISAKDNFPAENMSPLTAEQSALLTAAKSALGL